MMPADRVLSAVLSRRDFVRTGLGAAALAAPGSRPQGTGSDADGLLIQGGTVVTAAERRRADVRVRDERIAEIGEQLEPLGEKVIDAAGLLVLPGGIDPHVHLTQADGGPEAYRLADDLTSGSEAALAGGVTTIGNMTVPGRSEDLFAAIERDERLVAERAIADIFLHPVLLDPTGWGEDEVDRLRAAGHTSVKIFMVIPSFDEHAREYVQVMRLAGAAGLISVMHCEDGPIIAEATRALVAAGQSSLRHFARSRPLSAEVIATRRAIAYGEATGAPIYVVHLSAEEPLRICSEARARGLPVYVETRPIYLSFTEERYLQPDGPLFVGQPPLRSARDVEALWAGLEAGTIQTLGTDHVGWTREQKMDSSLNVEDLRPGVPNLQEMLPVLFSEGVVTGRLTPERFVQITSANPAMLFGLHPRKGTVAVGSDADLVLWAPGAKRTIGRSELHSRGGFSLFEGWEVTGWPAVTIRRGAVVFEDGQIKAQPGSGQVLRRGPTQTL